MQASRVSVLLLVLIMLITITNPIHSEATNEVYYLLVYNPVENSGVLIVNVTISLPNCDYVIVPVKVFGEEAVFTLLNYTVIGNLLVAGVDYNKTTSDLVIFTCNSGVLSIFFTANNVFSEIGFGAYTSNINTTPLRDLGVTSTLEIKITGSYDVDIIPIEVTYIIDKTANITTIIIQGQGQAYIVLTSTIEIIETPTPTPTPTLISTPTPTLTPTSTPQPLKWYERSEVLVGLTMIVIIVVAIVLIAKKK